MQAFVNTEITKQQFSDNIIWHHEQDKIITGTYWDGDGGCAVGCSIYPFVKNTNNIHVAAERITNVPQMLWQLEDCIFEGLPGSKQKDWPLRFNDALVEGKDYTRTGWQFLLWLLREELPESVSKNTEYGQQCLDAISQSALVIEELARGLPVNKQAADAAYAAACSASSAARAAARAAADAAYAAADAARAAARAAVDAAVDAAARTAADAAYAAADAADAAAHAAAHAAYAAADAARAAARAAVDAAVDAAARAAADAAYAAADAAYAAAHAAAHAAARAAADAAYAAADAAYAAARAAVDAAYAAACSASSAARAAADAAAHERMADKLIELMEAA